MLMDRPALVSIAQTAIAEDQLEVVITLAWHDAEYSGQAIGPMDARLRPRLVGEATLRAVEEVTDNKIELSLAAVATTPLGDAQVAMAQVLMTGDDGPFVGSALLRERDDAAATVRAVLDAINRRLAALI